MIRLLILLTVTAALAPSAGAQSATVTGRARSVVTTGPFGVSAFASESATDVEVTLAPAEPFEPDVYPSQADAARGLGVLWARRAAENAARAPHSVRVY